ncbi:MAG: metallophosphoesterase [Victivallaceae bacterium]|nr:metallophosphoesterase [Victivallaceae bacterium]
MTKLPVKSKLFLPERAERWHRERKIESLRREKHGSLLLTRYEYVPRHPAAVGVGILFCSDLHFQGSAADYGKLEALRNIAREEKVDYIVLGGDLAADAAELDLLPGALDALPHDAVKLAVFGNWERAKSWIRPEHWKEEFARHKVTLLRNESWSDERFFFYGLDEIKEGCPLEPAAWPYDRENVLISHSPDGVIGIDFLDALNPVSLALTGHTHGGQIRLPLWGALFTSSSYGRRFDCGIFRRSGKVLEMIVSSGMGECSLPWRFRCPPEAWLIRFVAPKHNLHSRQAKEKAK